MNDDVMFTLHYLLSVHEILKLVYVLRLQNAIQNDICLDMNRLQWIIIYPKGK